MAGRIGNGLRLSQIPAPCPLWRKFLVEVFEGLLDGRNARLTDGVRQVLGRAPRDFTDFVREAAAAGTWKA